MTTSETDARLAALEDHIDRLTAELTELRAAAGATSATTPRAPAPSHDDDGPVSRRQALRTAGAVAVGALATGVATSIAGASPAAAVASPITPATGNPAVSATADPAIGTAIAATSGEGRALDAESTSGTAVYARSDSGTAIEAFSIYEPAINGQSQQDFGVVGTSNASVGGRFVGATYGVHGSGALASYLIDPNGSPPPLEPNTYARGAFTMDQNGGLWICVVGGTPGTWRQLAGSDTAGSYHPLTPTRVYDSRAQWPFAGRISTGQTRNVSVADGRNQDGVVTIRNLVPSGATAVYANVTVVDTAFSGWLAVNPGGTTTVGASSINWSGDGQILANGVALTINAASRNVTVIAGGPGSTDFVIDVYGYWR